MMRQPFVAGSFYRKNNQVSKGDWKEYDLFTLFVYSPHYSSKFFDQVEIPGNIIIPGINHQGNRSSYAINGHAYWHTPHSDAKTQKDKQSVKKNKKIDFNEFSQAVISEQLSMYGIFSTAVMRSAVLESDLKKADNSDYINSRGKSDNTCKVVASHSMMDY
jgi:predicted class III extradiol MEMO1 family dioxygenase